MQAEVPVWVAALAPITYGYAVKHGCDIQSWPLMRDTGEAQLYMDRMAEALANNPGKKRPTMAMMRHRSMTGRRTGWSRSARRSGRCPSSRTFFKNLGDVENGFPKAIPFHQLGNWGGV